MSRTFEQDGRKLIRARDLEKGDRVELQDNTTAEVLKVEEREGGRVWVDYRRLQNPMRGGAWDAIIPADAKLVFAGRLAQNRRR